MSGNVSFWKKEIHLRPKRRPKADPVVEAEPVVIADTPPAEPEPELTREPEAAPAEPWVSPYAPPPEPEPVVAAEPPTESWLPRYEPLPADISGPFAESEPEPEPVAELHSEPVPEIEPEPVADVEPWVSAYAPPPVAEPEPVVAAEPPTESWLPRYEPLPASVPDPVAESATEPEPVAELHPEPVPEIELEPVADVEPWVSAYAPPPEPEPVVDAESWLLRYEPLPASVPDPVAESAPEPEPVAELHPEPVPEIELEPVADVEPWVSAYAPPPEPEPVVEAESWLLRYEPLPASVPDPVAESAPEPEPVAELHPEPAPEIELEPVTDVEPWVSAYAEPEPVAELEPVVAAEPPTESWLPRYEPLPASLPDPFAESAPEPEPEPVAEIEPELEPVAEFEPEPPETVREFVTPEPKRHWWKKEVSRKKETTPLEAEPSRAPREPRAKRSLRKPSLPKLSKRSLRAGSVERVVGLKIGGSQIAAACVTNNGSARLERVVRTPLASGIVSGGELRDVGALADALRKFFDEYKLPKRGVRLGVASSRIGVRSFEIPAIADEAQFVNAVRFRAQEALPIPLDEAVIDYRVLEEREGEDGGESIRRVLLVVAHRELVDRYVEACELAGLTLAGIDLEAFALLRALAAPADSDQAALVAVSLGHDRTTLAVSDGRVCEFTRVLEWGGWALNNSLARALDTTPEEAEQIKRTLSLSDESSPAVDALRRGVEALARELLSSLAYYQSQPDSLAIGEVVVTGGTARLGGLAEELSRLLGVPVRVGDALARVDLEFPVADEDRSSLAIAVGLGIED